MFFSSFYVLLVCRYDFFVSYVYLYVPMSHVCWLRYLLVYTLKCKCMFVLFIVDW